MPKSSPVWDSDEDVKPKPYSKKAKAKTTPTKAKSKKNEHVSDDEDEIDTKPSPSKSRAKGYSQQDKINILLAIVATAKPNWQAIADNAFGGARTATQVYELSRGLWLTIRYDQWRFASL